MINDATWGLLDENIICFHHQKKTQVLIILNAELNTIFQIKETIGSIWFKTNLNGKYFYFARFRNENNETEYIQASFLGDKIDLESVWFPKKFELMKYYSPIYNDNNIVYGNNNGYWTKTNLKGDFIWESKIDAGHCYAWNDNYLYFLKVEKGNSEEKFIEKESTVVCLSQEDGSMLWRNDIEGIVSTPILLYEDRILVESKKHGIVCIEASSGQILWNWKKSEYQCCRKYTIDYEGILHILEVDIYYQLNLQDGSIMNVLDLKKELKRFKIKIGGEYVDDRKDYGLTFGMSSFQPSVSAEHFLIAIFNQVIFVNKSTGKMDYSYLLEDKRGKVSELAIIGENRIILVEACFSSKMPNTIWKVLESVV